MLELRNVTVRFGDRAVLDDLSLDLEAGTVAAVLGASGSGKTTLLRAIAGLQPLDGGSIAWRNTDLSSVPPHRRNFGLMFQDYALFPHRSVARNVAFGLEMQGAANPSARVAEVLGMVGLEGAGDRSVSTLSGGEQQRVGLARALAPQPEVLMLDEPLGALDRSLRDRLALELRELFTTLDLTVLYVTHDQDEAFAVADDIIVLAGGKVVQHATPEDLWTSPATPYVAEFLGMTMLTGEQAASLGIDGGRPVALRPERAAVVADGPISATVTATRFADGTHRAVVRTEGGVVLSARSATRRATGDSVGLALDPDAVVPVGD